jgi:septum formation protein
MRLVLASASPRRRELLAQIGIQPLIRPVDIDETPHADELALTYVERMAKQKLITAKLKLSKEFANLEDVIVVTCDTSVIVDELILGKPKGYEDFMQMMRKLSGRAHKVVSTIAISGANPHGVGKLADELISVETEVEFKVLSTLEMNAYWQTGEPLDKAGGYGIQSLGALFVSGIKGSYSNVVGLPLQELHLALRVRGYATVI